MGGTGEVDDAVAMVATAILSPAVVVLSSEDVACLRPSRGRG